MSAFTGQAVMWLVLLSLITLTLKYELLHKIIAIICCIWWYFCSHRHMFMFARKIEEADMHP